MTAKKICALFREAITGVSPQDESIQRLMRFKIEPYVISRLMEDYGIKEDEVDEVVLNFKIYFSLFTNDSGIVYALPSKMKEIDQMWHTYLLYTREYARFCDTVFKRFIHHVPDNSIQGSGDKVQNRLAEQMANTIAGLKDLDEGYRYRSGKGCRVDFMKIV